jgi:hypothetical protein
VTRGKLHLQHKDTLQLNFAVLQALIRAMLAPSSNQSEDWPPLFKTLQYLNRTSGIQMESETASQILSDFLGYKPTSTYSCILESTTAYTKQTLSELATEIFLSFFSKANKRRSP